MPVWHDATRRWAREGKLAILGVTQEQHAERCRLFAQWKEFDWPILHDPINLLDSAAVPIVLGIDEHGIVRLERPRPDSFENAFVDQKFRDDGGSETPRRFGPAYPVDLAQLNEKAGQSDAADNWRTLGDALILWGGADRLTDAVAAYRSAIRIDADDRRAHFRLGVALRQRYESPQRHEHDFRAAVDHWGRALELDPNQYIWRRRIQQYGPRLDKPYPFYDWVTEAERAIAARGEDPVTLAVRPNGAEIARPNKTFDPSALTAEPDAGGKIIRIEPGSVTAEATLVPRAVAPGQTARVHLVFRVNKSSNVHWNNEAEPLRVWINAPPGWSVSDRLLSAVQPEQPVSAEERRLEFELQAPADAMKEHLTGYALFHVCEEDGGTCRFVRLDFTLELPIAATRSR